MNRPETIKTLTDLALVLVGQGDDAAADIVWQAALDLRSLSKGTPRVEARKASVSRMRAVS